ncbi:MAG: hypothetical protein Q8K74_00780 [Candidatus Nitrotoga sp.]|nr:hypothetical protein [Candidatus Nitrotoga sp.]MDP1854576.1 hypothetical protein [Candidatus Nitrotoga sp.]
MIEVEQGIVFVDLAQGTGKMFAAGCAVGSLFRRFAIEAFVVGFRIGAGMVDDAVAMVRRHIERIELQRDAAGIDDVVIRSRRNDYRKAGGNRRTNAIENCLAGSLLHAEELVEFVDFRPDLFLGLKRHDDELAVPGRVKHLSKIFILDSDAFNVLHITFHSNFSLFQSDSF